MMPPAFSSLNQAGAFALLLLLILLSPLLLSKSLLSSREQMYLSTGAQETNFAALHQQIYDDPGDIDIAFLSSSRLMCAIDPDYVQDQLSKALGRPAVVRRIHWNWNGFDALYFISRDFLQHRKIRMLVTCDLSPDTSNIAHHNASCWFRWGDDSSDVQGLPLAAQISFYSSSIVGIPRNLVGLLRHNPPPPPLPTPPLTWFASPFDYTPHTPATPTEFQIYSDATKNDFQFSDRPLAPMQEAFVRKTGQLLLEHHTQLVTLNVPFRADWQAKRIRERRYWPDAFGIPVTMAGIPADKLFSGLSQEDVSKLYFDYQHFNQNGLKYYTPLVTPTLIKIYEDQIKP